LVYVAASDKMSKYSIDKNVYTRREKVKGIHQSNYLHALHYIKLVASCPQTVYARLKHFMRGWSVDPFGVKLSTYDLSKAPADHPT
jgi:hypothetical protein